MTIMTFREKQPAEVTLKTLPDRIFFTGVPGSRWSSVAQTLEQISGINTSDHSGARQYSANGQFNRHTGAYFGHEMEFRPILDAKYLDMAWTNPGGCKIVKSHEWAYRLNDITNAFPNDWIMMVYRPDASSYAWWHEAGGFNISYPSYKWYKNHAHMLGEIAIQNDEILKFAHAHDLTWSSFTDHWIFENFAHAATVRDTSHDMLVAVFKG